MVIDSHLTFKHDQVLPVSGLVEVWHAAAEPPPDTGTDSADGIYYRSPPLTAHHALRGGPE